MAFSPLVVIQDQQDQAKGSTRVPFFCVHGAGGNVLNFWDIAKRLGSDQPFFALQAYGVDGSPPLESIDAMSAAYLKEIRRVQPRGPYCVGGYSSGGIVAYDMAQRLRALGESVALVALLDSFGPSVRPAPTSLNAHAEGLRKGGPAYLLRRAEEKMRREKEEIARRLKIRFYEGQGKPLPLELRERRVGDAFVAAADRYDPKPYTGRVILYRAAEITPVFQHAGPKQGWAGLVPELEVVVVPGDHATLVLEPNVEVMTSHLRAALGRASAA